MDVAQMEIDARIASDEIRRLREENARLREKLVSVGEFQTLLTRERDEAREAYETAQAEVARLEKLIATGPWDAWKHAEATVRERDEERADLVSILKQELGPEFDACLRRRLLREGATP